MTTSADATETSRNINLTAPRGLTMPQAARLWGLDSGTCAVVLTTLLERQVLRRTAIGTYRRGPRG